jgi:hypothetical protein
MLVLVFTQRFGRAYQRPSRVAPVFAQVDSHEAPEGMPQRTEDF